MPKQTAIFAWDDPFLLEEQLSDEEKQIRDTTRQFAEKELRPHASSFFHQETFDPLIIKKMGHAGLLGATIQGYGCAGVSYVSYGLMAREIEAIDSGFRSALSVQSS